MKTFLATAAMGLATFGFAGSASAFHFLPKESTFTARGSFTVSKGAASISCHAEFHGTTVGRGAEITSATFSGSTCVGVTPSNLPWDLTVGGPHSVKFHKVTFTTALGVCGPGVLKGQDTLHGKITMTGEGLRGSSGDRCAVTATLNTNPNLTISGD